MMRVLMVTAEWPTLEDPNAVPFIVRQTQFLTKAGIELEVLAVHGRKHLSSYVRVHRQVHGIMREKSFDLVHAQWGQSGAVALFPRRLPLVVTFRGSDLEGIVGPDGRYTLKGAILRHVSRVVARMADEVIVVSPSLAALLPRRHCHVIPSGLDLQLFRPLPKAEARATLGLDPEKPLVLFGGNPTVARKRFGLAQTSVALVGQYSPEVALIPMQNMPHDTVPLYMNACDVLLLTSMHEGSPNVVKEALACNLPIVSVDVGDVRSRLTAIEGCIVCPDSSPQSICAALIQVLQRGMRINGRWAVQDLDERLLARKTISVYEQVLSRN